MSQIFRKDLSNKSEKSFDGNAGVIMPAFLSIDSSSSAQGSCFVVDEKVIIVEGGADRKRLVRILAEPVTIICTNGTISPYRLEELLAPFEEQELFVFVDADEDGEKIRVLFKREYPDAIHLYTEKTYREVETTPDKVLASILLGAEFKIRPEFLT